MKGQGVRNFHRVARMRNGKGRKTGLPEEIAEQRPTLRGLQGRRHGARRRIEVHAGKVQQRKLHAILRRMIGAVRAAAAAVVGKRHPVAHGKPQHTGAHLIYDAGAFVPQHHRQGIAELHVAKRKIGVTHPGGTDLHPNFAGAGVGNPRFNHLERHPALHHRSGQHCHRYLLVSASGVTA